MKVKGMQNKEVLGNQAEKPESPSQLYTEAIRTRPSTSDVGHILADLTNRLESLAKNAGMSVKEFLTTAENSPNFNEDYLEAVSMARQIARLKTLP